MLSKKKNKILNYPYCTVHIFNMLRALFQATEIEKNNTNNQIYMKYHNLSVLPFFAPKCKLQKIKTKQSFLTKRTRRSSGLGFHQDFSF